MIGSYDIYIIYDLFCKNVPKVTKTTIEIGLKICNNNIFQKPFVISYHSFSFVRSFKVFGSPCVSGELLKQKLLYSQS